MSTLTTTQLAIIVPVLALLVSAVGLQIKIIGSARKAEKRLTDIENDTRHGCDDIDELQAEVRELRRDLDTMLGAWKMVAPALADILHKPHPEAAATDRLLEIYGANPGRMKKEDRHNLRLALRASMDSGTTPEVERLAAALILVHLRVLYPRDAER